VDVNISYYNGLTLKKKKKCHVHMDFFDIKLILDYYFCLKSGPVFYLKLGWTDEQTFY
jgi:hypothetical protein